MKTNRITTITVITALLLCIPLVAMHFSTGVNWSVTDFIIAALLLFGTGLLINLILSKVKEQKNRLLLAGLVLVLLVLVWMELAVGVFGTPFAGN